MNKLSSAFRKGDAPFDSWSPVHVASGAGLALLGASLPVAVGLIVGFEVLEAGLRRIKTAEGGLFEYESWSNITADIILGMAGFAMLS